MTGQQSTNDNTTCLCGRPAHVTIETSEPPLVSNSLPFGKQVCSRCHFKHQQFKQAELNEWLDYFEPRMRKFPLEYSPPVNGVIAIIHNGRGIPAD